MVLRKGDIAITICQNNNQRQLTIEDADAEVENIIGYSLGELKEMQLQDILPVNVAEQIESYLDYEEQGNDLAAVLSKVRNFGFLTKLGKEARVNMRISRSVTEEDSNPRFKIVIRDASEVSVASSRVLEHLRGHQQLDPITELPNRETFNRDMEFVNFCIEKDRIRASFALISIDQLQKIIREDGRPAAAEILREVSTRCKMNFRTDDFLAYLENDYISVVLLEAPKAEALIPLNRLRYGVANKPLDYVNPDGQNTPVTITIAYMELEKGRQLQEVLDECIKHIEQAQAEGGNKIIAIS